MRIFLKLAILLLSLPAFGQTTVTDNFSGSGALSGNWTNSSVAGYVACNQFSGNAQPATALHQCIAAYTGASFTNNQYAQFVANGTIAGNATSPGVRFDNAGNGYVFSSTFGLYKLVNGTGSVKLASCTAVSPGDLLYISAVGSLITGTDITTGNSCSATDSSYPTGQPAIYLDNTSGSNNITLFQAGTFVGFSVNPSALVKSTTGNAVALTGTNTTWSGSPFSVTGAACSITSQTVTSTTTANLTVNAGGTVGTCTVHDATTGTTAPISIINNPIAQAPVVLDCTAGCHSTSIPFGTPTANGSVIHVNGWSDIALPYSDFTYNTKQYLASWCPTYTPTSAPTQFAVDYGQIKTLSSTAVTVTESRLWHGVLVAYEIQGENLWTGASCTGTNTGTSSSISASTSGQAAGGFSVGVAFDLPGTPTVTGTLTNTDVPFAHGAIFNSGFNSVSGSVNYNVSYASASGNPGISMSTYTFNPAALQKLYPPILNPAGGNYATGQSVTVSEPMLGTANIRCTLDGTTPNSSSPIYTGPIPVTSGTVTVSCYAQALANVVADGPVSANTYVITAHPTQTWFVRPGGGGLFSAANPTNTCDGLADLNDPGSGALPRHCAINDLRWLYDNKQFNNSAWVIQGGDTVVVRGCVGTATNTSGDCRVGYDNNTNSTGWCSGGSPFSCIPPPLPSGTSGAHTKLLGGCAFDGTCAHTKSNFVFIHGGFGVFMTLDLQNAQWVDVAGIYGGSYGNCVVHGSPNPNPCNSGVSDYIQSVIQTNQSTHDVTLTDMWVQGGTDRGVKGPIGGTITSNYVTITINGMAGWDFDDGTSNAPCGGGQINCYGSASVNGTWNFLHSTISWSGCNQEFPFTHPIPVAFCFDQSFGGYGDGIGTPPGMGVNVDMEYSQVNWNTQDGEDFGHIDSGNSGTGYYDQSPVTMLLKANYAYANEGSGFKTGPQFSPQNLFSNFSVANGQRIAWPVTGVAQYAISSWAITGCPGAGVASFVTSTQAFNSSNLVNFAGFPTSTFFNGLANQAVAASGLSSTGFQISPWNCSVAGNGSATEAGIVTPFNGGLGSLNRPGGGQAWSMNVHSTSNVTMVNNTLVTYQGTAYLQQCWEPSYFCPQSTWNFSNNITFGIQDALPPSSLDYGTNNGGIGGIFFNKGNDVGTFTGNTNQWFGVRTGLSGLRGIPPAIPFSNPKLPHGLVWSAAARAAPSPNPPSTLSSLRSSTPLRSTSPPRRPGKPPAPLRRSRRISSATPSSRPGAWERCSSGRPPWGRRHF